MENPFIIGGLFGFIGGTARASVGVVKALRKKEKFRFKHFLITLVASGIIGIFTGLLPEGGYKISMIAGYAGTDLIDGIYKIKNPKSNPFS